MKKFNVEYKTLLKLGALLYYNYFFFLCNVRTSLRSENYYAKKHKFLNYLSGLIRDNIENSAISWQLLFTIVHCNSSHF